MVEFQKAKITLMKPVEPEKGKKAVALKLALILFSASVVTTIFLGGIFYIKSQELKKEKYYLQDLDNKLAAATSYSQEITKLKSELGVYESAIRDYPYWSYILKEIERVTPPDISLGSFSANIEGKISLPAKAPSYEAAARCIKSFSSSKAFTSVKSNTFSLSVEGEGKKAEISVSFGLEIDFDKKALTKEFWTTPTETTTETTTELNK